MNPHEYDPGTEPIPPAHWTEGVRTAFWAAVNAPTYTESTAATLAFAHELAEMQRAWAHGARRVTALEQSATNYVANMIDPKATK